MKFLLVGAVTALVGFGAGKVGRSVTTPPTDGLELKTLSSVRDGTPRRGRVLSIRSQDPDGPTYYLSADPHRDGAETMILFGQYRGESISINLEIDPPDR